MDPWVAACQTTVISRTETVILAFEDNFKPLVRHSLPDSAEYLAILESRLKKIKSDPNVLRQLAEKREACMRQLLLEESFHEGDTLRLEEPVEDSPILRAVAPHKQALTQGETVQLIHHDQLERQNAKSEE